MSTLDRRRRAGRPHPAGSAWRRSTRTAGHLTSRRGALPADRPASSRRPPTSSWRKGMTRVASRPNDSDPPGDDMDDHVDGNVLAGPMREIFTTDITVASGRCVGCDWTGPIAGRMVYAHAPGMVGRCPSWDAVVLRLGRSPERDWLDRRGVMALEIPLGPE